MCEEERYGELVCFSAIWAVNLHLYNPLRESVNNFLEAILLESYKGVRLDPAWVHAWKGRSLGTSDTVNCGESFVSQFSKAAFIHPLCIFRTVFLLIKYFTQVALFFSRCQWLNLPMQKWKLYFKSVALLIWIFLIVYIAVTNYLTLQDSIQSLPMIQYHFCFTLFSRKKIKQRY